ncbi:MAG: UPF0262 family protein [Myxococcales bacterium]|nr:UPF0262 family protein [Myxococcales bacterium]
MLETVTIDPRTWSEASEARRLEWGATIREMLTPGEALLREDAHALYIEVTQQAFHLRLLDAGGGLLAEVSIPHDALADLVHEYVDVVRELARVDVGGLTRVEALDMAKKVTHDKAGRLVQRRCADFGLDHPTARRLFSLLFAIRVDTTRLHGVHGHRRIR